MDVYNVSLPIARTESAESLCGLTRRRWWDDVPHDAVQQFPCGRAGAVDKVVEERKGLRFSWLMGLLGL